MLERVREAPEVCRLSGWVPGQAGVEQPPGPGGPDHVWYVSYGSNLLTERFQVYLMGGRLAGLDLDYPGGEGTSPAAADRAVLLPGRLRFAMESAAWGGGGVAFWDPSRGPGVLARAWRVRRHQFLEVVHLENGGRHRVSAPWPERVLVDGSAVTGDGWYSRLQAVGEIDGEVALTFTNAAPAALVTRAPGPAYHGVVARGVLETFGGAGCGGLRPEDADAYLTASIDDAADGG